jgi:hypothetical protein
MKYIFVIVQPIVLAIRLKKYLNSMFHKEQMTCSTLHAN